MKVTPFRMPAAMLIGASVAAPGGRQNPAAVRQNSDASGTDGPA